MEPRNQFQGMNSANLAGRYDNPLPSRFLAPIDCLKIPAQSSPQPKCLHLLSPCVCFRLDVTSTTHLTCTWPHCLTADLTSFSHSRLDLFAAQQTRPSSHNDLTSATRQTWPQKDCHTADLASKRLPHSRLGLKKTATQLTSAAQTDLTFATQQTQSLTHLYT